jgi:type III pantothenate kinase
MLLAIDVGNTNTVLGLFEGDELVQSWRIKTDPRDTADELHVVYTGLLSSSPRISGIALRTMFERYYGDVTRVIVEPGTRTGVPVLTDNPKEVGADRIVNTLAAHHLFGGPSIVVDFGTSTNLDVVSAKGEFLGGALAPGIEISLDALAQRAAQLRKVELLRPRSVIGRNTVEALQSGALYGFAGQVDGLVERIEDELGEVQAVVATGGLAPLVVEESRTITHHEPELTLVGLRLVYERNTE